VKRLLLALICVALPLALTPAATLGATGNLPGDSATGSGVFNFGTISFSFSATSGPLGESPQGTWRFGAPDGDVSGDVTCLAVQGNKATLGGPITSSTTTNPFFAVGRGVVFTVVDNGPGPQDMISGFQSGVLPTVCAEQFLIDNLEQGDVVVHDAPCDKPKEKKSGLICKK
jgi:hypothetical protein